MVLLLTLLPAAEKSVEQDHRQPAEDGHADDIREWVVIPWKEGGSAEQMACQYTSPEPNKYHAVLQCPQMVRHWSMQARGQTLVDHVHSLPMAGGEIDVRDAEDTAEEEDDRDRACKIHGLNG